MSLSTHTIQIDDLVICNAIGNLDVRIGGTVKATVECSYYIGEFIDVEKVIDLSYLRIEKIVNNSTGEVIDDYDFPQVLEASLLNNPAQRFTLEGEVKQISYEMITQPEMFPARKAASRLKTPAAFAASNCLPKFVAR